MDYSIADTLDYVLFLTRHIPRGNVRAATLAVLMDLGFPEYAEGFGYLRTAICVKIGNFTMRVGAVYQKVAELLGAGSSEDQVEQGIRSVITDTWKYRNVLKWQIVFPTEGRKKQAKPTNGELIAKFACLMELWQECCKEVSYAG